MTRLTVHEYAAGVRPRSRTAKKGVKRKILDQTTGMHRKAAIRLLNLTAKPRAVRRGRPGRYGPAVAAALVHLWEVGDRMCGKLLAAVMPDLLGALERHGELNVTAEVGVLLLQISSSTIDRLLRRHRWVILRQPQRKKWAATGLKSQVPIRTWREWRDVPVGSLQAAPHRLGEVVRCGADLLDGKAVLLPEEKVGERAADVDPEDTGHGGILQDFLPSHEDRFVR